MTFIMVINEKEYEILYNNHLLQLLPQPCFGGIEHEDAKGSISFINYYDILAAQSCDNYIQLSLAGEKEIKDILYRSSLKDFTANTPLKLFCSGGRYATINILRLTGIDESRTIFQFGYQYKITLNHALTADAIKDIEDLKRMRH